MFGLVRSESEEGEDFTINYRIVCGSRTSMSRGLVAISSVASWNCMLAVWCSLHTQLPRSASDREASSSAQDLIKNNLSQ